MRSWLPAIGGILLVVGVIIAATFLIRDAIRADDVAGLGRVVGKDYDPAHTEVRVTTDAEGNMTTSTEYVPADWDLRLETEYGPVWVDVNSGLYEAVEVGDRVRYTGRRGKLGWWGVRITGIDKED